MPSSAPIEGHAGHIRRGVGAKAPRHPAHLTGTDVGQRAASAIQRAAADAAIECV